MEAATNKAGRVKYFRNVICWAGQKSHFHQVEQKTVRNNITGKGKGKRGKAIPLQAWTGPNCSRRLRLPDFTTVDT
jgi:hypothetical protein